MGKILNMLYAGDLHPADCVMQDSADYQALCRESLKEVERFTEKLDAGMKAEFDTLMEHYLELTYLEKTESFSHGFRLGAGIMCEVFSENGRAQA